MTMTTMRMLDRFDTLTHRELAILRHLQDGLSAADIAGVEYVAVSTVRSQIAAILMKLGVKSQLAAVAKANRRQPHFCQHCQTEIA